MLAAEALLRQLPFRNARLRVTSRGVSYLSPELTLEITPSGIVLVAAGPLPAATRRRVLQVVHVVGGDLGFLPGGVATAAWPAAGMALTENADARAATASSGPARDTAAPGDLGRGGYARPDPDVETDTPPQEEAGMEAGAPAEDVQDDPEDNPWDNGPEPGW